MSKQSKQGFVTEREAGEAFGEQVGAALTSMDVGEHCWYAGVAALSFIDQENDLGARMILRLMLKFLEEKTGNKLPPLWSGCVVDLPEGMRLTPVKHPPVNQR